MKRVYFSFFYLFISGMIGAQDIFDYNHSVEFANYLLKTKHYSDAADEYRRLFDISGHKDTFAYLSLYCCRKSNNYPMATILIDSFFPEKSHIPAYVSAEYLNSLVLAQKFRLADSFLAMNKKLPLPIKNYFELNLSLLDLKTDKAAFLVNSADSIRIPFKTEYRILLYEAENTGYKSPVLAGCMSAIIPGLGKIYTHNTIDGIYVLGLVAVNVFQAYRGFSKKGTESVYGWVSAGLAGGFYLGNIYGSVRAAKKYNYLKKKEIKDKVEILFNSHMDHLF